MDELPHRPITSEGHVRYTVINAAVEQALAASDSRGRRDRLSVNLLRTHRSEKIRGATPTGLLFSVTKAEDDAFMDTQIHDGVLVNYCVAASAL